MMTDTAAVPMVEVRNVSKAFGNVDYKQLLARWLESDPQLVILDEPTRGVDVGAKAQIHELIRELARRGKGVLLISSDLPELLTVSDRILVLREGRVAAELNARNTTQEEVLMAASGFGDGAGAKASPKDLHASGTALS